MLQITGGLAALEGLACATATCEQYKFTLIDRALTSYARLADVVGEWEPILGAIGGVAAGVAGTRPTSNGTRPPGSTPTVGSAQVEKAYAYWSKVKAEGGVAAKGAASALETTKPVVVSGGRAIDKAQSYESGVRDMYGATKTFEERQFRTVVDGKVVNGVADDVAVIGGKKTAVEAKFVEDWNSSIRNPASPSGSKPWSAAEQAKMVEQAKKYSSGFDGGAVYHTNSPELASYYSKLFTEAGVTKFKFIITPTKN